jgi:sigma-B regulation protein RsbU (phosphoserine phosphatase)
MSALPALRGLTTSDSRLTTAVAHVHAVSRPARTFTGDFYFTHRHDDRLWIAIGDVAGKGLPAAIVMAMIQEELEHRIISCASTDCDPSATMQRLHEFLLPLLPRNRFATAVIGWLDRDGTLTIANAGHCPPLILRADGSIEKIGSTGPIAGVLPNASWRSVRTRLHEGDALVLYSDGLTEARVGEDELGVWGLEKIMAGVRADALPEAILSRIPSHDDDLTLVIVRPSPSV